MLRTEYLTESVAADLDLSPEEASSLAAVGRRLASDRTWLGEHPPDDRTVIRCTPAVGGRWTVRVQDAVGIVSVGGLQIVVRPKIPRAHLLHLFAKSLQVPRLDDQPALAEHAAALWELVARWFVRSTTTVLRRDLSRDYHGIDDVLHSVRGRVHGVPTARAYYAGRIELHCSFDDFAIDTPLNRLLRAAAREVSRSTLLTPDIRKDAARLLARFEDVGELREPDFSAAVDRRTWYYRDAVVLARHILRCVGRTFEAGAQSAWSFLIRTPELVEAGIRQILSDNLGGIAIRKLSAPILGATFGAHPDIVFGPGWAVGDVKYKLNDGSWNRPDLYEVVAFASAFRCQQAALLCFAKGPLVFDPVGVGEINVAQVAWNCSAEPARASEEFCETVRVWANRLANCQTLVAARANRPAEA